MSTRDSYPAPNEGAIFARPAPLRTAPGLRLSGSASAAALRLFDPIEKVTRAVEPASAVASSGGQNWKPKKVDATHITISSGDVAGAVATIGGVSLDDPTPPQLEVSATDLVYVYLKVVYSLSLSADGVVLPSSPITSREISAETGEQTDTDTDRWFLLFKWQAGRVVEQKRFYSIGIDVSDNGLGAPFYRTYIGG